MTTALLARINFEVPVPFETAHHFHDGEARHADLVRDLSRADPCFPPWSEAVRLTSNHGFRVVVRTSYDGSPVGDGPCPVSHLLRKSFSGVYSG
jgi:hypothetical protein